MIGYNFGNKSLSASWDYAASYVSVDRDGQDTLKKYCTNSSFKKEKKKSCHILKNGSSLHSLTAFPLKDQEPTDLSFHPETASKLCLLE